MNAVEIQRVQQRYGSMQVLHDLDLTLGEGEVLGLFGHNGAGKTTTMKLILGLLSASEGSVRVLGGAPGDAQVRRLLGYLPENVTFYPQLSGRETLSHFARLKGAEQGRSQGLLPDEAHLTGTGDFAEDGRLDATIRRSRPCSGHRDPPLPRGLR